jgi:hypothetical protein
MNVSHEAQMELLRVRYIMSPNTVLGDVMLTWKDKLYPWNEFIGIDVREGGGGGGAGGSCPPVKTKSRKL